MSGLNLFPNNDIKNILKNNNAERIDTILQNKVFIEIFGIINKAQRNKADKNTIDNVINQIKKVENFNTIVELHEEVKNEKYNNNMTEIKEYINEIVRSVNLEKYTFVPFGCLYSNTNCTPKVNEEEILYMVNKKELEKNEHNTDGLKHQKEFKYQRSQMVNDRAYGLHVILFNLAEYNDDGTNKYNDDGTKLYSDYALTNQDFRLSPSDHFIFKKKDEIVSTDNINLSVGGRKRRKTKKKTHSMRKKTKQKSKKPTRRKTKRRLSKK